MSKIKHGIVHLTGDGTWSHIDPYIDGEDIVMRLIIATHWGDPQDTMDKGTTASGRSTYDNPDALWSSLPMNVPGFAPTAGSPLPKIPWGTIVRVFSHKTRKVKNTALEDLGPAKWTEHGADFTDAVWRALGVPLSDGTTLVDVRIVGGAKYVV